MNVVSRAAENSNGKVRQANKKSVEALRQLGARVFLKNDKVIEVGANMTKLEKLWLNDTAISDAAIPTLSKLKSLRELYVYDTMLTPRGIGAPQEPSEVPGNRAIH